MFRPSGGVPYEDLDDYGSGRSYRHSYGIPEQQYGREYFPQNAHYHVAAESVAAGAPTEPSYRYYENPVFQDAEQSDLHYVPRARTHAAMPSSMHSPRSRISRSGNIDPIEQRFGGGAASYSGAFSSRSAEYVGEEETGYGSESEIFESSPSFSRNSYSHQQQLRQYEEPAPAVEQESFDASPDGAYGYSRSYSRNSSPYEPQQILTMPGVYAPPVIPSTTVPVEESLTAHVPVISRRSLPGPKKGSKDGLLPRKSGSSESCSRAEKPEFSVWQKALAATSKAPVKYCKTTPEASVSPAPVQSLVRPREEIVAASEPAAKKPKTRRGRGSTRTRDAAFLYFVTSEREKMTGENARAFNHSAKELSQRWQNMTEEERQRYAELSQADKLRYEREKAEQQEKMSKASSSESVKST